MHVSHVVLVCNQSLCGKVYLRGSEFYITHPYRHTNFAIDESDVFDSTGEFVGLINDRWSDFNGGEVFALKEED